MASFGKALEMLKGGKKVSRVQWVGNSKFIFLVPGSTFNVNRPPLNTFYKEGTEIDYQPHIDVCVHNNQAGVWTPEISDLLAEDWKEYTI